MQTPHFAPGPIGCTQLPDFDPGSRPTVGECLGTADLYRYWRLVKILSSDQLVPVDFHDTFVRILSPRHQGDAVSELVGSEPAQSLLTERKALMFGCSSVGQALPLTMVVPRDQPDRPEYIERHALPVVGNDDHGLLVRYKIELNDGFIRVRVISVLDQLEDCQPCAANQLVAKQL